MATRVYAYHGGKSSDEGVLVRPRSWEASHALEQIARQVDISGEWVGWLPADARDDRLTVHFKPIAAGDVVLGSRTSPLASQLHGNYNDAVAIEMESAGVSQAGHLGSYPVLTGSVAGWLA